MNRDDRALRDLLRLGDPASDSEGLGPEERARMRQAVVEASRNAAAHPRFPRAVVAGVLAAAIVVTGLGILTSRRSARTDSPFEQESTGAPAGPSGESAHVVRQVQIATPGGTRVVWVLNSDFRF